MKYSNIIKNSLLMAMVALATTACQEDITYGSTELPSGANGEEYVYVTDANGSTAAPSIEFRNNATIDLQATATKPLTEAQSVQFAYNADALDAYNTANGTQFEAVPQSIVTLSNGGVATIAAGETKSAPVQVALNSDGSLDPEKSYVIPLSITAADGSRAAVAETAKTVLIYVKDLTSLADCAKTYIDADGNEQPGVKIFSCMEVNDTNPLNNLSFTLKKSGKYLYDALIIFSANVNIDPATGEVIVFNNENVQALLDNREHYLKPLQDRGMKVILGLLGNHDGSGIANLSDETARKYAQEIKSVCDAYNLDGVFWDDEYSEYNKVTGVPGFVTPSKAACSRLVYEVWKLQPERWNVAYAYSTTYGLNEVDGVPSGVYCQYALHDYGGSSDLSSSFPSMPKSNMGLYSQEFAQGRTANETNLRKMRDNGYGSHMIFAMDPNRSNFNSIQLPAMQRCARAFYDDELVFDGKKYRKDWR